MGFLFGGGSTPKVQKADPPPAVDDARVALDERAARRQRAGRAASLKVTNETAPSTARSTLGY